MNNNSNSERYADIINLPHHQSVSRTHMSIHDRAAQFSAFVALTEHPAAIQETARLTDKKIELDEYIKEELNRKLQIIYQCIRQRPVIGFTYFIPDKLKSGGSYQTISGIVKKTDLLKGTLLLENGTLITIDDIFDIAGELFD